MQEKLVISLCIIGVWETSYSIRIPLDIVTSLFNDTGVDVDESGMKGIMRDHGFCYDTESGTWYNRWIETSGANKFHPYINASVNTKEVFTTNIIDENGSSKPRHITTIDGSEYNYCEMMRKGEFNQEYVNSLNII